VLSAGKTLIEFTLNANQRAVVDADDSPMLVVAGPGAGKTTVLQARIERILAATSGSRFRILGITFTTVAAAAIRVRLETLAVDQRQRVEVGTFHAFAAQVLRQHGSHIGLSANFTIISASEDRLALLTETMAQHSIDGDARTLLPLLTKLYEKGAESTLLAEALEAGRTPPSLRALFVGYLEFSTARGQLDFGLLIYLCLRLFRQFPVIPRQLRKVYKHICVDEFQDTSDAQFALLELLTADTSNGLLFLADQDQLIYQWNGASPRRLQEAQQRFGMNILLLPTSFRCPNIILEVANNLIRHNSSRFVSPTFTSSSSSEGSINVIDHINDIQEREWLARELADIPPDRRAQTAVISRARKSLDAAMNHCDAQGIPVTSPIARYEFESAPLIMLHNIMRLAAVPGSKAALKRLAGAFYEITGRKIDPSVVWAQAEALGTNPFEVFLHSIRPNATSAEFATMNDVAENDLLGRNEFRTFSKVFFNWAERVAHNRAATAYLASYDVEKALWLDFEIAHRGLQSSGVTLQNFVQALDLESKAPKYSDRIYFLTAHGAKGLEFSRVLIIGAAEKQFPTFQAVQLGDRSEPMEEERRSFFVAVTRCSRDLSISYAEKYAGWATPRSRFLSEMGL